MIPRAAIAAIAIAVATFAVLWVINPQIGTYTRQHGVCSTAHPREIKIRVTHGQTLQHYKNADKASNDPFSGCEEQVKYVQYFR